MEDVETKAQSQGQDSQILSENVEGFQQRVKEILNLIKQDEDFSEIKKSKLTETVTELSRMYGALADQHEHLIKEVKTEHVGSSKSEFFMSTSKHENPPINDDALKVNEEEVPELDVLFKQALALEKEILGSDKEIQDLIDENAIVDANMQELMKKFTEICGSDDDLNSGI